MYEKHFGLTTRPFAANAEGDAVFIGPQQAKVVTGLTRALATSDAIVTVTGPVGVGKTTIVTRALESLSPGRVVAWVGRMQLAHDEVLELLLAGFGISRQAKGTIQRFAAFRRLLNERARSGSQVAIVVEDAIRIGTDALVELEALTATDSGDTSGANIVLMGQPALDEAIRSPELARLSQRTRLRQTIEPFGPAEVQGYLRHRIRAAGGDFDSILAGDAADMLYRCAGGIPRVINNLCEAALQAAAEADAGPVTADLIGKIAADEFGIEVSDSPTPDVGAEAAEPGAEAAPDEEAATAHEEPPAQAPEADDGMLGDLSFEPDATSRMPALSAEDLPEPPPVETADTQGPVVDVAMQAEPAAEAQEPETSAEAASEAPRVPASGTEPPEESLGESQEGESQESESQESESKEGASRDEDHADIPLEFDLEPDDTQRMQAVDPLPVIEPAAAAGGPDPTPDISELPTLEPSPPGTESTGEEDAAPPPAGEAAPPELQPDAEPLRDEPVFQDTTPSLDDLPTLSDSMRIDSRPGDAPEATPVAIDEAPAGDPQAAPPAETAPPADDPEPARKVPDIDALEAAIAAAHKGPTTSAATPEPQPEADPDGTVPGVPKLTLDESLEKDRRKDDVPHEVVEGLGKAQSIEEIDDQMAETLFGDEDLDRIAAEIVANPPTEVEEAANETPVAIGEPAIVDDAIPELALEETTEKPAIPESTDPGPPPQGHTGEFHMSMTQRVAMLNSLKGDGAPPVRKQAESEHIELAEEKTAAPAMNGGPAPEPIEEQIQTSITQTLKALGDIRSRPDDAESEDGNEDLNEDQNEDDTEEKKSGGLFSRFRKSS